MHRWSGRVALVTGASVGIGAATAETLVKAGMTVIGCARNVQQIQDLARRLGTEKGKLEAIKCDLTKEEEILTMFETIKTNHGRLDVCVNNAGLAHQAPILSGETWQWRNMLDVNVLALCICTREAFKLMKEKGIDDGHIVLINSLVGHMIPQHKDSHFYCASKYAVRALCGGIRHELTEMKSNIRITEISPGVVETEFAYRMRGEEAAKAMYTRIKALEPADIAATIEYVLGAPPHVQVDDVLIRPKQEL